MKQLTEDQITEKLLSQDATPDQCSFKGYTFTPLIYRRQSPKESGKRRHKQNYEENLSVMQNGNEDFFQ